MNNFIIEHPTRGTVQGQEPDDEAVSTSVFHGWRTRFAWSGSRVDSAVYYSPADYQRALIRIHPDIRKDCVVRRYGSWEEVALP
jgi:hypothetical protein